MRTAMVEDYAAIARRRRELVEEAAAPDQREEVRKAVLDLPLVLPATVRLRPPNVQVQEVADHVAAVMRIPRVLLTGER